MLTEQHFKKYQALHKELCGKTIGYEQAKSEFISIMELVKVVARGYARLQREAKASQVEITSPENNK